MTACLAPQSVGSQNVLSPTSQQKLCFSHASCGRGKFSVLALSFLEFQPLSTCSQSESLAYTLSSTRTHAPTHPRAHALSLSHTNPHTHVYVLCVFARVGLLARTRTRGNVRTLRQRISRKTSVHVVDDDGLCSFRNIQSFAHYTLVDTFKQQ